MKNLFNSVKMTKLQRNLFDLTHDVKLSMNMGNLVPILKLECIPGDTHTISSESLVRFAPMLAPVMHRYDVTTHYFFVPNRLVWPNWENYITNTKLEETDALPAYPFLTFGAEQVEVGSLPDYLGIPVNLDPVQYNESIKVSAIPFAAYQLIYNEYYRDQNLIDKVNFKLVDGDNNGNINELTELRKRAWEHDYFTACLPFAQKGNAVEIPLGKVELDPTTQGQARAAWKLIDYYQPQNTGQEPVDGVARMQTGIAPGAVPTDNNQDAVVYDPNGTLQVTPTTINDLRRAFRLQEWLEKAARGGSRYIEWIKVMFGVTSSDARLQRPEYICGSKTPVMISEVLNTTGTETLPQGNMSGHGVAMTMGNKDSYYCEEHGYIIGIMSILPKPAYFQGLERDMIKLQDPTQYYFSSFANIGEQEVFNQELLAYQSQQAANATFGYIPRYAEYRFQANRVCGEFRTSLDYWHQARIFGSAPQLNQTFIECNPDTRIFAVEDPGTQKLYCQVLNKIMSMRPIPKYGTPTF